MFVDLDWPLNASSLLLASAELLVKMKNSQMRGSQSGCCFEIFHFDLAVAVLFGRRRLFSSAYCASRLRLCKKPLRNNCCDPNVIFCLCQYSYARLWPVFLLLYLCYEHFCIVDCISGIFTADIIACAGCSGQSGFMYTLMVIITAVSTTACVCCFLGTIMTVPFTGRRPYRLLNYQQMSTVLWRCSWKGRLPEKASISSGLHNVSLQGPWGPRNRMITEWGDSSKIDRLTKRRDETIGFKFTVVYRRCGACVCPWRRWSWSFGSKNTAMRPR